MNKNGNQPPKKPHSDFSKQVGMKEQQKLKAQQESVRTIWSGLAMFGMIGWSVVVPTLIGIGLGRWLDRTYPMSFSWTLILLELGLVLGCVNAWHWIAAEEKKIRK